MTRLLLSLYPRAWRERYGAELSDLINNTGLTPRVAFDVARGAAREWAGAARDSLNGGNTMVIGPAYRHPRPSAFIALVLLAPTLLFTLLSMLTYQFGLTGLASVMEPVNSWLDGQRVLDLILVALPAIALLVAAAPLVRVELRNVTDGREAVFGLRLKALNVGVVLLALLVGGLLVGHIVFESVLQVGR
jgi:hypothetical protein